MGALIFCPQDLLPDALGPSLALTGRLSHVAVECC